MKWETKLNMRGGQRGRRGRKAWVHVRHNNPCEKQQNMIRPKWITLHRRLRKHCCMSGHKFMKAVAWGGWVWSVEGTEGDVMLRLNHVACWHSQLTSAEPKAGATSARLGKGLNGSCGHCVMGKLPVTWKFMQHSVWDWGTLGQWIKVSETFSIHFHHLLHHLEWISCKPTPMGNPLCLLQSAYILPVD